jgi:3'-phosphoadenosine 5'-phosphosulfate (PAPS) 3'-phosphatase
MGTTHFEVSAITKRGVSRTPEASTTTTTTTIISTTIILLLLFVLLFRKKKKNQLRQRMLFCRICGGSSTAGRLAVISSSLFSSISRGRNNDGVVVRGMRSTTTSTALLLLFSHHPSSHSLYSSVVSNSGTITVQAFSGRQNLYHSSSSSFLSSSSSSSSSFTTAAATPNNDNSSSSSSSSNQNDDKNYTTDGFQTEGDFPETVRVALAAVRKACGVAQKVQEQIQQQSSPPSNVDDVDGTRDRTAMTQTKVDSSPVTVADYAAQAIILSSLHESLREDDGTVFLAEESSSGLYGTNLTTNNNNGNNNDTHHSAAMIQKIGELTGFDATTILDSSNATSKQSDLQRVIDIGQSYYHDRATKRQHLSEQQPQQEEQEGGGVTIFQDENNSVVLLPPPDRFWCLDPIDGTKGFLRGGQYCVALAFLEVGIPTIGILACPNLPPSPPTNTAENDFDGRSVPRNDSGGGCIFVACKGQGCYEVGMEESSYLRRLGSIPTQRSGESSTSQQDTDVVGDEFAIPSKARFSVGVEQGFSDPEGLTVAMGEYLHGSLEEGTGDILYCSRMDSQVKYGVIARGEAEFYVRLPKTHRDYIWDVAAGVLCLEEVGGKVTDVEGKPLDFTQGERLPTVGILGARTKDLHDALLEAYQVVSSKRDS